LKGVVLIAEIVKAPALVRTLDNVRKFARGELNGGKEIQHGPNMFEKASLTGGLPQAKKKPSGFDGVIRDLAARFIKVVNGPA
jgi:hypothetical protein